MDSTDLAVLTAARDWVRAGHRGTLVTVMETWGSAPRPPGAMLAIRDDGRVEGSVSGGCVEDDLIDRVRKVGPIDRASIVTYGVTKDEAARFGLPCGGTLRLVQEPIRDVNWIDTLLDRCARHEIVSRTLDLASGRITLDSARRADTLAFDGLTLKTIHGPRWRMLIIGAGQLSRYVAEFASALDFEVLVCDPREEYTAGWFDQPEVQAKARLVDGMPDDAVVALEPDAHTAIVALTHDPKLDDLALMEALKSAAFYIGALGSRANTAKRKARLLEFDLTPEEVDRLHGPIGLHIGSRTPAEIAVSIVAEVVAVRYGVGLVQKKPVEAELFESSAGPTCGSS